MGLPSHISMGQLVPLLIHSGAVNIDKLGGSLAHWLVAFLEIQ